MSGWPRALGGLLGALVVLSISAKFTRADPDEQGNECLVAQDMHVRLTLDLFPSEQGLRVGEEFVARLRVCNVGRTPVVMFFHPNVERELPVNMGFESVTYKSGIFGYYATGWSGEKVTLKQTSLKPGEQLDFHFNHVLRESGQLRIEGTLFVEKPNDDCARQADQRQELAWSGFLKTRRTISVSPERSKAYLARIKTECEGYRKAAEGGALDEPAFISFRERLSALGFGAIPELLELESTCVEWTPDNRLPLYNALAGMASQAYSKPLLERLSEVARNGAFQRAQRFNGFAAYDALRQRDLSIPREVRELLTAELRRLTQDDDPNIAGHATELLARLPKEQQQAPKGDGK